MTWPYPGDGPAARARRVAQAYRSALEQAAPALCYTLDGQMRALGQTWIVPERMMFDPDEWLSPSQAADLACVEIPTIRQMRHRKVIKGRHNGKHWEYQVKEIMAAFARPRGRNRNVTDTLTPNGSSVPNEQ